MILLYDSFLEPSSFFLNPLRLTNNMTALAWRAQNSDRATIKISCPRSCRLVFEKNDPPPFGGGATLLALPADLQKLVVAFLLATDLCSFQRVCRCLRRRFVIVKSIDRLRSTTIWLILKASVVLFSQRLHDFGIRAHKAGNFHMHRLRVRGGIIVRAREPSSHGFGSTFSLCVKQCSELRDLALNTGRNGPFVGPICQRNPQLTFLTCRGPFNNFKPHGPMLALRRLCLTALPHKNQLLPPVIESMHSLESLEIIKHYSGALKTLPDFSVLGHLTRLRHIKFMIGANSLKQNTRDLEMISNWFSAIVSLPALRSFATDVPFCDALAFAKRSWDHLRLRKLRNPSALRLMDVRDCRFDAALIDDKNGVCLPPTTVKTKITSVEHSYPQFGNLFDAKQLPRLESVYLRYCADVVFLGAFENLLKLSLSDCAFGDASLRNLRAPRLRILVLDGMLIAFDAITHLQALRTLSLANVVAMKTLDGVEKLRELRRIAIIKCDRLVNANAAADLPLLTVLTVTGCAKFVLTGALMKIPCLHLDIPSTVELSA
jgi:hypothetical protein